MIVLQGGPDWVGDVVFSPDGKTLAAVNAGKIRLWAVDSGADIAAFGKEITFSPDGRLLVSGSCNGTVRLWGVE